MDRTDRIDRMDGSAWTGAHGRDGRDGRCGLLGGGWLGERACRRTPCAERAVILPAVQSLRLACSEGLERRSAGRRAPHAERAVILPAVQSLRLACTERGALGERVGVLRTQREL